MNRIEVKITCITALCLVFIVMSAIGAFALDESIAGIKPGQSVKAMKRLGMPFPDDTSGIHVFLNPADYALLKFYVKGGEKARFISYVRLVLKGDAEIDSLNDAHKMLTRKAVSSFKTKKGLGLGDSFIKANRLYGGPDRSKGYKNGVLWMYGKPGDKKVMYLYIVKGKVHSISVAMRD